MTRFVLAVATVVTLLILAPRAFALSTESGNGVSGAFAGVTDPDEKTPPFVVKSGSGAAYAASQDSASDGQGFVSKDVVQQSVARGSGSYLPPESQKP